MKKNMEITDIVICAFAIGIAILTVLDRIKTRKEDREQAELTNNINNVTKTILGIQSDVRETQKQMDSTLKNVSYVQVELINLNEKMDGFIRANAEVEKNYKADRRKEAKTLFISTSYAILNQLDRLSIHGYYRMPENRIMAREHYNWAHYETIKLKNNIYVTENKESSDLVNELEAMLNLRGSRINYYENADNGMGGLGGSFGPINNKFQKLLIKIRDNDDL